MIGDIIEAIRQYFSWDRVSSIFPEGRGIYDTFEVDLSIANIDKKLSFYGDQIIITECESQAYLRLNDPANDLIDLTVVKRINSPFKELYITNSVGAGNLKILVGRDGMFSSSSIVPVDILKTNIGNIPIDIKALTIGDIPIDIKANTLGDIDVNLNTNSIGNIPIDIKASTLGNIPIDIKASTLGNIPVDIQALTIGNIDVDLNAQSIGNLDIDLNAQSINRLTIRDQDGGIESSSTISALVSSASYHNFVDDSGSGSLRWFMVKVNAQTGTQLIRPQIEIDGSIIHPYMNFSNWNVVKADKNTRPFQLWDKNDNGQCVGIYYFEKGLVFDSTIKLRVYNGDPANNIYVTGHWFYQKL